MGAAAADAYQGLGVPVNGQYPAAIAGPGEPIVGERGRRGAPSVDYVEPVSGAVGKAATEDGLDVAVDLLRSREFVPTGGRLSHMGRELALLDVGVVLPAQEGDRAEVSMVPRRLSATSEQPARDGFDRQVNEYARICWW